VRDGLNDGFLGAGVVAIAGPADAGPVV